VNSHSVVTVSLSPTFKLVFISVLVLTVICLLLACTLVMTIVRTGHDLSSQANALFDLSTSMFKLGFGAIIGLLGGKAL
jgi:hypothetical protein